MQRRHRDAVTIAGRHRRHPTPALRPQRESTFLELDMRSAIEAEAAEQLLHLLAAELVADLRGPDVRAVDQRLGNVEPAVHHVRLADVEAGDGARLGRVEKSEEGGGGK